MASGKLKRCLSDGRMALGSWIAFPDLYAVEVMGRTGFDWVLIDLEHSPIGLSDLRAMLPILESTGTATVVRVPDRGDYWIKQALDMGADGVMIPRVDSSEIAQQVVRFSKYHPLGERGFGPVRASRFGDAPDYLKAANENSLLFVQLEHRLAVDNLDSILDVDGIDGYFIGPGDLSQSLGLLGQLQAPEVKKAERIMIDRLHLRNKTWGTLTTDREGFRYYVELGGRLLTLGGDLSFLKRNAEKSLEEMREVAKRFGND